MRGRLRKVTALADSTALAHGGRHRRRLCARDRRGVQLVRHSHQLAGHAIEPASAGSSGTAQPSPTSRPPTDSQSSTPTAQQSAEAVQGPAAVPTAAQLAALKAERGEIAKLSPEQLAGQRVVYSYNGLRAPAGLLRLIRHGDVGGVIFFSFNISSQAQLRGVISQMIAANAASSNPARHFPLLLMTDQEGGQVRRLPWAGRASPKRRSARRPIRRPQRPRRALRPRPACAASA